MFVTAAIDLTAVLPFAIFGLFAAAAWIIAALAMTRVSAAIPQE